MARLDRQAKITKFQMGLHLVLTILWIVMIPVAIYTGWIESIVFVAAISIYANFAGHFAAFEAARSEWLDDKRDKRDNG